MGKAGKSWFEHSFCQAGDTAAQAREALGRLVDELGLDHYCYVMARPPRDGVIDRRNAMFASYPQEWIDFYVQGRLLQVDPVVELSAGSDRPFYWGDGRFRRALRKQQRWMFEEARAVGLGSGLSIPVRSANGATGVFNVVCADPKRLRDAVRGEHQRLFAAAYDVHDFALGAAAGAPEGGAPAPRLTIRERECLLWTAEGKTAEEVAAVLGLSVFTVNRHVSAAAHKLNCTNKYHAAIRALRAGLI